MGKATGCDKRTRDVIVADLNFQIYLYSTIVEGTNIIPFSLEKNGNAIQIQIVIIIT
jgi:hypothetical protein